MVEQLMSRPTLSPRYRYAVLAVLIVAHISSLAPHASPVQAASVPVVKSHTSHLTVPTRHVPTLRTADGDTTVTESFQNSAPDTAGWVIGGSALLTSGYNDPVLDTDPAGQGWLRFNTPYDQHEVGYVYYDTPLDPQRTLSVSFDYACWGGAAYSNYSTGADGASFFLFDGATTSFAPGVDGGGLGYSGMPNAYLGVGLDEFGDFSNGAGGLGNTPGSVVVRGSAASSNAWGTATPGVGLCDINAVGRPGSQRVTISLAPSASGLFVTVQVGSGTVIGQYDVGQIPGQGPLPATVKFGIAGAVGEGSDAHEIRNVSVTYGAASSPGDSPTATASAQQTATDPATSPTSAATDGATATSVSTGAATDSPTATDIPTDGPTATGTASTAGTATMTGTEPATGTATLVPTTTVTASTTATETATAISGTLPGPTTETPSAQTTANPLPSTAPTATDTAGDATPTPCSFSDTLAGWTFGAALCEAGEADDVSVAPPGGLQVQGTLPHDDVVDVDSQGRLLAPVRLPDMTLTLAGFTVNATDVSLDSTGLTIGGATLRLPGALGGQCAPLYITGLHIGTDLKPSGGTIHMTAPLQFAYAGAQVSADGLSFGPNGLAADSASLTLPPIFGSPGRISVQGLQVHGDGTVAATVAGFTFAIGDLMATASDVTLNQDGLSIGTIQITVPFATAPANALTVHGFTYDGSRIHFQDASGQFLGGISLGGFRVDANVSVALSTDGATINYDLTGTCDVTLPQFSQPLSGLGGSIEIGSIDGTHPSHLRAATISVSFSPGIPIPETPLLLTKIDGGIHISANPRQPSQPIYEFQGGVNLVTDDGGYIFSGKLKGAIATDGNFGLGGSGSVLNSLLTATGGFCVRLQVAPDGVCTQVLPTWGAVVDASQASGFFAEASLALNAPCLNTSTQDKCVALSANGFLHVWRPTPTPTDTSTATATPSGTPAATGTSTATPPPTSGDTPSPTPPAFSDAANASTTPPELMLAGTGQITATVPAGAFGSFLFFIPDPLCQIEAHASAQIGTFHFYNPDNGRSTYPSGLKGSFSGQFCSDNWTFDKNIFIGTNGVDWDDSSVVHYTLLTDPDAPFPPQAPHAASAALLPRLAQSLHAIGRLTGRRAEPRSGLASGLGLGGRLPRGATLVGPGTISTPLRVAPGQVNTFVGLTWRAGAPSLTLVAPDGAVYTPAAPGAANRAFLASPGQRLPHGATGATVLLLSHPAAGLWHVRIGNLRGGEGYRVEVQGDLVARQPVLRVDRPAAGRQLAAAPAAPVARLSGTLSGAPDGSAVSLWYASSPTLRVGGRRVPNTAGALIADPVLVRHGRWSYRWNTDAVPAGTYYVYATLDNGAGTAVRADAAGTVRVVQPARPAAPRHVVGLARGRSIDVLWAPPARAALLAGYRLRWRPVSLGRPFPWRVVTLGMAQSATLDGLTAGRRYQVAVSAVDVAGHESDRAQAPLIVLARNSSYSQGRQGRTRNAGPRHAGATPGVAFTVGAPTVQTAAGSVTTVPLSLRPHGRGATGGAADYVEVDVHGLPSGMRVIPAPRTIDLFAQGQGSAAPALQVVTVPTLRPGVYHLTVTVWQHLSGRVRSARVRVVVTASAAVGLFFQGAHGQSLALGRLPMGSLAAAGLQAPRFSPLPGRVRDPRARPRFMPRLAIVRLQLSPADAGVCAIPANANFMQIGWELPGDPNKTKVTPQDFMSGFTRVEPTATPPVDLSSVTHWATPTVLPSPYNQGYFMSVNAPSDYATNNNGGTSVPFISRVYYGPLQYEPAASSGLSAADIQAAPSALTSNYCSDSNCTSIGRSTGIIALLQPESIRNAFRRFSPRSGDSDYGYAYGGGIGLLAPGEEVDGSTNVWGDTQPGHLLGYVLGGLKKDPRNFVGQFTGANTPRQSNLERYQLGDRLAGVGSSESYVYYRVTPDYVGNCVIPYQIRIQAIGQSAVGWTLSAETNPTTGNPRYQGAYNGTQPGEVIISNIRETSPGSGVYRVPGQDPGQNCAVPPAPTPMPTTLP